jgi:outer membrane protein assembly factor BamB
MRRVVVLILFSLLVLFGLGSARASSGADWQQFRFGPSHAGFNAAESSIGVGNVASLTTAWTATTGADVTSSPAVANGLAYVGSEDGKLYAFDAMSGAVRWTASAGITSGGDISSSPAVAGGVVYIGSSDYHLYAFDAASGALRWLAPTRSVIESSPTVAAGIVYVTSWDHTLDAFDAATGTSLWTVAIGRLGLGGAEVSSPAVADGVVYVGSIDYGAGNSLYAFNATTGASLWGVNTGGAVESSPAVVGGVVYVGSDNGHLSALDAGSGALLWTAATGSPIFSSPAVAGGVVYAGSYDGNLYAFDAATGALRWSATTTAVTGSVISSPAIADGVVYVGSYDGKVYAFDAASGTKLWSSTTGNAVVSSPTVSGGLVYVGSNDRKLYAYWLGATEPSPDIAVTPADSTDPVGTTHTVTASVTLSGAPVSGQSVDFAVTGQNAGASGSCVPISCSTDAQGNVSFSYRDTNGAGNDDIVASLVDGHGSRRADRAVEHWVAGLEQPISARAYSISATEGAPLSGDVAAISDPDPAATASEYTATIDWGDNSHSAGAISGPTGGPFTVHGTHTYAEEGRYVVSVTVEDVTAINSAFAATTAAVADAALSATCSPRLASAASFDDATAGLSDDNPLGGASDFTASINWGDNSSSAGTVSGERGTYTVGGSHQYSSAGYVTITTSITDAGGSTTSASCRMLVYLAPAGGGAFVIGNRAASGSVSFWGAGWSNANQLSDHAAPAAFKGFATNAATPGCGTVWSTAPGNSPHPPAGPLPAYMAVIVSSAISQSGSSISGNTLHIVVVKTNPGYNSDPGHAGTGTVVATIC